MSYIKSLLGNIPIGIALALELAIAPAIASPALSQSISVSQFTASKSPLILLNPEKTQTRKQSNPPPPPTNPGSSVPGGRRDPSACPQDAAVATRPLLTALSPTTEPGLTLAEHPTFLVYVPTTSAENAEFSLRDREGHGVYRTIVALTHTPTIISISLSDQATPLEVGKQYTWSFAIICNPGDRIEDRFVTATVRRTELDPTRLRQIEQTPPQQRIALYQENGIWYDALALLFELQHSQPNDSTIGTTWRDFLQSAGVDNLIDINLSQ